jgi:hypothetical protein
MDNLEVELLKGQNTALVDLFDSQHARRVLAAFGTAYGNLPKRKADISKQQDYFLDQAIAELSQDGRIIPVQLALFAEMTKGKPWNPATLRDVGGTEGLGVAFLEENFSSPQANPKHRVHQKAAQAVLRALLPEVGTDIREQMRSEAEMREISGYYNRPKDFADLIRVLDSELRLITPTDPEGSVIERRLIGAGTKRCFQLTHDYSVRFVLEWLTRKQRESVTGRAELLLRERCSVWVQSKSSHYLPNIVDFARIHVFTDASKWDKGEREMMSAAGWYYLTPALVLSCLTIVTYGLVLAARLDNRERFGLGGSHYFTVAAQISWMTATAMLMLYCGSVVISVCNVVIEQLRSRWTALMDRVSPNTKVRSSSTNCPRPRYRRPT